MSSHVASWELSAEALAGVVARGERSARSVVEEHLARADRVEPVVGAFVRRFDQAALERAEEIDRRRRAGRPLGPLAGVPVAVKENLAIGDRPLTAGSRILEGYRSPFTATAVERLEAADAVVVGQTSLDELAMGSSTETGATAPGPTRNPHEPSRVPGGSSGGSAAAVAAGAVPLALGSDTGGSVRQPAALCGVAGLAPTYGRISRWGLVAHASSMDRVGLLARGARDIGLALSVVAGLDPGDATSADRPVDRPPVPAADRHAANSLAGLRIGVVEGWDRPWDDPADELTPEVATAVEGALDAATWEGARIVPVPVPSWRLGLAAYIALATAEASSNLARYDGVRYGRREGDAGGDLDALYTASRSRGLGEEVQRRILTGSLLLERGAAGGDLHRRARQVAAGLAGELAEAFARVDLLATPTTPAVAFRHGARLGRPVAMARADRFTVPASLAGLPALSVPAGLGGDSFLPVGLQLVGPAWSEGLLLRVARAFELLAVFDARPVEPGEAAA